MLKSSGIEKIVKTAKFQWLLFLVFSFVISITLALSVFASDPDAIAVRVIPNQDHLSAEQWYKEKGFSGSPQALIVDGFEAVRDGRTVYVNAGNSELGILYTNIYVISYNQDATNDTVDIFGQILEYWKFSSNFTAEGKCRISKDPCLLDADCGGGADNCDSMSARIRRDVRRLSDLRQVKAILNNYKGGTYFPPLSAGSYLPQKSLSVWPSWVNTLSKTLSANLPVDPVNKLGECPGYESATCWDDINKKFAANLPELPDDSLVYYYGGQAKGNTYALCTVYESGLAISGTLPSSAICAEVCLDFDNDGYGKPGSAKCKYPQTDCDDTDPAVLNGTLEGASSGNCSDGIDNDCDGFVDCFDNGCAAAAGCASIFACGNGTCESGEDCNVCPADCGVCPPTCPDGFCDATCNECSECPADCAGNPSCCGVGGCNTGECLSCPGDCTVGDCCGDGTCSALVGENQFNCPLDCLNKCFDNDTDGYDTCNIGELNDDGKIKDCNDVNAAIHPGAIEACDGVDNDCDGHLDNGFSEEDCSFVCIALNPAFDYNSSRSGNLRCCGDDANEGGPIQLNETSCSDGRDNDCDGLIDSADPNCMGSCGNVGENDWIVAGQTDCNQCDHEGDDDGDQSIGNSTFWNAYPGMADTCDSDCGTVFTTVNWTDYEIGSETKCDGKDNDCDGTVDEGGICTVCIDNDGDSHSASGPQCPTGDDCNDSDPYIFPGNPETCDGKDNDCDGTVDEGCDDDHDQYCDSGMKIYNNTSMCPKTVFTGNGMSGNDCNDTDAAINPGASEICDGKDNDCNSSTIDGSSEVPPPASLQFGVCSGSKKICSGGSWIDDFSSIAGYEASESTCDDTKDNDCDNSTDCTDSNCAGSPACNIYCKFNMKIPCKFP